MKYSAITIQGNILTSEILEKIRTEDIRYQTPADFTLDKQTSLRDEIGIAWAAAKAHWQAFQLRRERLKDTDTGTSETRQSWLLPVLREFGYDLEKANAEIINGKSYAISHRAVNRGNFPTHLVGINQSLDKRADIGGTRLSPHALVQEYLNNQDHLYGLVSNGRYLRLLRDATRLSRLSYLEFDLERILMEDLFAEFALLFRVLHVTRMPVDPESGAEAIIECYHQDALASGSRIRERLSGAVEESLKGLANGLLKHPANVVLRQQVSDGRLRANQFYLYILRLVYRMLFLLVIEERHLIFPPAFPPSPFGRGVGGEGNEGEHKRQIYERFYSITRLTRLAEKRIYVDPRKTDLWQSLLTTFRLFENGVYGEKLGLKPLGAGLFAPNVLEAFETCRLENGTLLQVLERFVTFENEHQQRVRVNYADLDVEEFGSVYEGLLEYDAAFQEINGQPVFVFVKGQARSASGSHYTPEELVKPLIEHSLEYLIQARVKEPEKFVSPGINARSESASRLKPALEKQGALASFSFEPGVLTPGVPERALLSIRVADVACGSGHILLSAARRIGLELARVRSGEDQPAPPVIRQATRDVIRHCIYGVDKNPLAVELCKVALWLEAHNPGEPLSFLDHHIKCGDSIVGLAHKEELLDGIADEAFKRLPGDDKEITAAFGKRNRAERQQSDQISLNFAGVVEEPLERILAQWQAVETMPETTPEEITAKQQAYERLTGGERWWKLKTLADMQTAQFFIPKTAEHKPYLVTDADYRAYLNGTKSQQDRAAAKAIAVAVEQHFFHWFLEFPEVFAQGGFDCVLGNPPFLGGSKISTYYGDYYLHYLYMNFEGMKGQADYVGYFFRRIFTVIKENGFQALIATNSIAQGDTREGTLAAIQNERGSINFAVRSIRWPGLAAVSVTLVSIFRGKWKQICVLDNRKVGQISSYLDDAEFIGEPFILRENDNKAFKGSEVIGNGFIISSEEARILIEKDNRNIEVIFPYMGGEELTTNFDQKTSKMIINFKDWEKDYCELNFPDCFKIIEERVKPERLKNKDKRRREIWWQFSRPTLKLYDQIESLSGVFACIRISKYVNFILLPKGMVYNEKCIVTVFEKFSIFALLQSVFHNEWAWKNSSTLGATTIIYSPSACFQTFPFPQALTPAQEAELEQIGADYHEFRRQVMLKLHLGLTKLYNQFHNPALRPLSAAELAEAQTLAKPAFVKRFGKQTWELWKALVSLTPASSPSPLTPLPEGEGNKAAEDENSPRPLGEGPGVRVSGERISFNEAVADILHLRELHKQMDEAVLSAYGWQPTPNALTPGPCALTPSPSPKGRGAQESPLLLGEDLGEGKNSPRPLGEGPGVRESGEGIYLRHDFYEVDYLPENDRIRYTIHPDARKEILKRLLLLNHAIHAAEVRQGGHAQKGQKKKAAPAKAELAHAEVKETPGAYGEQQSFFG